MKNYIQPGDQMTIPAPANVLSGAMVVAGLLTGVAAHDALSGQPVTIARRGVFTLPKTSAQAWTVGQLIYVIPATGNVTTVNTAGNIPVGVAADVAANPSATGQVLLFGAAVPAAV